MSVADRDFNPSGKETIAAIKQAAVDLELVIKQCTPPGRRQSLALTHLETAAMFAVKSAAVGDD